MASEAQHPATSFIYKLILFMSKSFSTELFHSSVSRNPDFSKAGGRGQREREYGPHKRLLTQQTHGLPSFKNLLHYESIRIMAVSISVKLEIGANIVIFQRLLVLASCPIIQNPYGFAATQLGKIVGLLALFGRKFVSD